MVEKRFEKLGMPDIERFENYLPTAFNSELTLLQKVNKIIFDLIETNKLTNEMVDYLNQFIETFDEKLYKTVEDVLKVWLDDGLLADIVRDSINEEVIEARTDYLDHTYLNLKDRLDKENKEVTTQLTQIEINKFDRVNVRDFGAVGDGVTDDSQSIQDAIDFANSLPIKTVFIPDGDYLIKETIIFYNQSVIRGAGERGTRIIVDVPYNEYGFKSDGFVSRVHLSHFRIDPIEPKKKMINAIDCRDMRYSSLKHLVIFNFNVGISFDGECYVNYIQHNRMWGNLVNIDVNRTENMLEANHFNVNYNEFYDSDFGIRGLGGRSQIITNNVFERVDTAIQQANTARPLVFRDNYLEGVPTMLRIEHSDLTKKFIIENNYIHAYGGEGRYLIEIGKTTAPYPAFKYITIKDNFFHNNLGGNALVDLEADNYDRYIIDFYGNTFSTVNNSPIAYYLDIFSESSQKPFSKANFFKVKTDLPLLDLKEAFPETNWVHNASTVLLAQSVDSMHNYGMVKLSVNIGVGETSIGRVNLPSGIIPYSSVVCTGQVIYTDYTVGLIRLTIRYDGEIVFEGIDSSKTVSRLVFTAEYGNRNAGIY